MQDSRIIRDLLVGLLAGGAPELGARLKQRLMAKCQASGLGTFSERDHGYSKFSDYLQNSHGTLVSLTRPSGPGDILVSLTEAIPSSKTLELNPASASAQPRVRSELWQAFSNPDARRKRYLHRSTMRVLHFLDGEDSAARKEVEEGGKAFAQIHPIDASSQLQWMREYMTSIDLRPAERAALDAMLAVPYSSQLNATFTKALAQHAPGWTAFRVKKIVDHIEGWAKQNSVPGETIFQAPREPAISSTPSGVRKLDARQQAIALLELIPEDDIARLILPTMCAALLVRSRA